MELTAELGLELIRHEHRERLPRWDPRLSHSSREGLECARTRSTQAHRDLGLSWAKRHARARDQHAPAQQPGTTRPSHGRPQADREMVRAATAAEDGRKGGGQARAGSARSARRQATPNQSAQPRGHEAPAEHASTRRAGRGWAARLNAYSYVEGRPLAAVDPQGAEPITLGAIGIGILIGAAMGSATAAGVYTATNWNSWNLKDFGTAAGIGAVSGAVGGAVTGIASGLLGAGLAVGAGSQSYLAGAGLSSGWAAVFGGGIGSAAGSAAGSLAGGGELSGPGIALSATLGAVSAGVFHMLRGSGTGAEQGKAAGEAAHRGSRLATAPGGGPELRTMPEGAQELLGQDERLACLPCFGRSPAVQNAARFYLQQAQRAWNAARPHVARAGRQVADVTGRLWDKVAPSAPRAAEGAAAAQKSFFQGTRYTQKVLEQMKRGPGEFHSFPESVTAFEKAGTVRTITGGDGVARQMLEIPGSYSGRDGVFQFIKEADGAINHRLFVPTP